MADYWNNRTTNNGYYIEIRRHQTMADCTEITRHQTMAGYTETAGNQAMASIHWSKKTSLFTYQYSIQSKQHCS
jgi:hypothetical protein